MKLVIDEKLKHRLIGIAVIVSLFAIFAPAVMKKSSQRFDKNVNLDIQLPARPGEPRIVKADEEQVFKTVKVAHVELNNDLQSREIPELAEALPIKPEPEDLAVNDVARVGATTAATHVALTQVAKADKGRAGQSLKLATANTVKGLKSKAGAKLAQAKKTTAAKPKSAAVLARKSVKAPGYAVQLASFSNKTNAVSLMYRLKSKGYKAQVAKVNGRQGAYYKVMVGNLAKKQEALKLREKLAEAVKINGFIVTGVS